MPHRTGRMSHLAGQGEACGQEHAGPVDRMEPEDILPDDVHAGGPPVQLEGLGADGSALGQEPTQIACNKGGISGRDDGCALGQKPAWIACIERAKGGSLPVQDSTQTACGDGNT